MRLTQHYIKQAGSTFHGGVLRGFAKAAQAYGIDPDLLMKLAQTPPSPDNVATQSQPPQQTFPVATGNTRVFSDSGWKMNPFQVNPRSAVSGAFTAPSVGATPAYTTPGYANTVLPKLRTGLQVEGPKLDPVIAGGLATTQSDVANYDAKLKSIAQWQRDQGINPNIDPNNMTTEQKTQIFEHENDPLFAWTRDLERGIRGTGAKLHQRLYNWARRQGGLPPETGMSDQVKNTWYRGKDPQAWSNFMDPTYQARFGAVDKKNFIPDVAMAPESQLVDFRDAKGVIHKVRSDTPDDSVWKMVGDKLVHRSNLPNQGRPIFSGKAPSNQANPFNLTYG